MGAKDFGYTPADAKRSAAEGQGSKMQGETSTGEHAPATREDVVAIYAFTLGRTPDEEAVQAFIDHDLPFVIGVFFDGPEFRDRVSSPLAEQRLPEGGLFAEDVPDWVRAWIVERLPVSTVSAERLRQERFWPALYRTLFTDPCFQAWSRLGPARPFTPDAWNGLTYITENAAHFRRIAEVENVDADWAHGWAVDRQAPDRPLRIELWADGRFVSSTVADGFRRDLQDRFGGSGAFGFRSPHLGFPNRRTTSLEIRDAETGRSLATARQRGLPSGPEAYDALVSEVRKLRESLDRIQSALPTTVSQLSFPLADYGEYAFAYGCAGGAELSSGEGCHVLVRLMAEGAGPDVVEDAVRSILDQTHKHWAIEVNGLDTHGEQQLRSLRFRLAGMGHPADQISAAGENGDRTYDICLVMPATNILAPTALASFSSAFRDETVMAVYADSDVFMPEGEATCRHDPQLKPAFDFDLLCQWPYVGECVAFRAGAAPAETRDRQLPAATVLRLAKEGKQIAHIPAVLSSQRSRSSVDAFIWRDHVQKVLDDAPGLSIELNHDLFGADVEGAVRVRRNPVSRTVSVIVPTRNALGLLKPCLDSVLRSLKDNSVALDLIVIDHASDEAETRAYLEDLQDQDLARVLPYHGPFNWALMNNLAVEQALGQVLIFLNNDTIVISPDWLDELASQAERADVGCVGARLLYEDGSIQHAGFVAREREANFLIHEGVGAPAADPGYMGRHSLTHQTVAVTGACMAIEAKKFLSLGGFDAAHFPIEGNDVDLCLRAWSEGLKVLYDPHVSLYHLESKSRGFSRDGERLNVAQAAGRRLWRRWGEQFSNDPFFNPRFDREARPFSRLRPWP